MRIALFTNTMRPGGLQRGLTNLAAGFVARGHAVELLLSREVGAMLAELPEAVRVREVAARWPFAVRPLFELPPSARALAPTWLLRRRPRSLYSVGPLAEYLRAERPDALLASPTSSALAALFAARIAGSDVRIVAREANTLATQLAHRRQGFAPHILPLVREWYPQLSGIVAVSEGVADSLASATGIPRSRIAVIHNPVDVAGIRARAAEAPPEPWLTTPGAPPVVLGAGRLVAAKDFATLLRAFAALRRSHEARLVILGEGPERSELLRLARRLGAAEQVRLPGHVANPWAYMARARVFALSSLYEGLANVVREALVCGCPVVATDCPSGSAEALGDGRYGRLVPTADPEALARALAATLDERDTPERAAERAASVVREDSVERYLALLGGSSP
jgi:glycosyltransferase involved in cell wall biosynthesis